MHRHGRCNASELVCIGEQDEKRRWYRQAYSHYRGFGADQHCVRWTEDRLGLGRVGAFADRPFQFLPAVSADRAKYLQKM